MFLWIFFLASIVVCVVVSIALTRGKEIFLDSKIKTLKQELIIKELQKQNRG